MSIDRRTVHRSVIAALSLLPAQMTSPEAMVMMFAIGFQESELEQRQQLDKYGKPTGPAKGLWQFERLGGTRGVINHPASRYWAKILCDARGVKFNATAVWNTLKTDDILAAGFARLLLFTDPKKLPALGDPKSAWNLYIRTWRPGKPHPKKWSENYDKAMDIVTQGAL